MNNTIAIIDPFDEGSTKRHQLISPSLLLRLVHLRTNFTLVLSITKLAAVLGWYQNKILFDALNLYRLTLTLIFL